MLFPLPVFLLCSSSSLFKWNVCFRTVCETERCCRKHILTNFWTYKPGHASCLHWYLTLHWYFTQRSTQIFATGYGNDRLDSTSDVPYKQQRTKVVCMPCLWASREFCFKTDCWIIWLLERIQHGNPYVECPVLGILHSSNLYPWNEFFNTVFHWISWISGPINSLCNTMQLHNTQSLEHKHRTCLKDAFTFLYFEVSLLPYNVKHFQGILQ